MKINKIGNTTTKTRNKNNKYLRTFITFFFIKQLPPVLQYCLNHSGKDQTEQEKY